MSAFYEKLLELCAYHNTTPSGVAAAVGLSNAAASGWKKGKQPNDTTQRKIARFFDIDVVELMGDQSVFYENYVKLCNAIGKAPSAVALEIGISKSIVSSWKHGRTSPTDATAQKIANYFDISVEELLGENEQKKEIAALSDDDLNSEIVQLLTQLFAGQEEFALEILKSAAEIPPEKRDIALGMLRVLKNPEA